MAQTIRDIENEIRHLKAERDTAKVALDKAYRELPEFAAYAIAERRHRLAKCNLRTRKRNDKIKNEQS